MGLDVYQFHYYDYMSNTTPLNYTFTPAELALLNGKPVIAGELQPTDVINKLNILEQYGYNGGLFWQDGTTYTISPAQYAQIQNWYYGTQYTYYSDGLLQSETLTYGNVYYHYLDENFNSQGFGRVDKQVAAALDGDGAIAYVYTYYWVPQFTVKKIVIKPPTIAIRQSPVLVTCWYPIPIIVMALCI